jgi:peptide/nickel transport system substrate-binding protein
MEFISDSATAAAALRTGEGSSALAEITRLFLELGLKVDYQAMDWGTPSARARSTVGWAGLGPAVPGSNIPLAGVKPNPSPIPGWTNSAPPGGDAPDLPAQKKLTEQMQLGARGSAFLPLGQYFIPYAVRSDLTGFVRAPITALWNVRRT